MATTTIQVSSELKKTLQSKKFTDEESFESVIWDLVEDSMELSEETKKEIAQSRKEAAEGKLIPLSQVKKKLGL